MAIKRIFNLIFVSCLLRSLFASFTPTAAPVQADTQGDEYVFRRSWGGEGEFTLPRSVAVGLDGRIYVLRHN